MEEVIEPEKTRKLLYNLIGKIYHLKWIGDKNGL